MTHLSVELQQLVHVGRFADRPTTADKERNRRQLQLRLGVAIGLAAPPLVAAQISASVPLLVAKITGIALASMALVFGGVTYLRGSGAAPWTQTAPPVDASMLISPPSAGLANAVASGLKGDNPPTLEPRAAKPTGTVHESGATAGVARERDTLSEEVALLARAQTDLQGGRLDSALRWIKEHERRFRRGVLADERIAAKIQVLCALGRDAEARAHLTSLSPKSIHGDAARQICGGTSKQPTARSAKKLHRN